ncbi:MAG TPA: HAMP domain-containing sensor histidine kinase [Chryseosolibacter sp.]
MKKKVVILLAAFSVCLVAGLSLAALSTQAVNERSIADKIATNLQRELEKASADLDAVSQTLHATETFPSDYITKVSYPFFIYRSDSLYFWSDNHFVPPATMVTDTFSVRFIKSGSESFLLKKIVTDGGFSIVSFLNLQRDYSIHNDYLNLEWNKSILPSASLALLDVNSSIGERVCVGGECLFRVSIVGELPSRKGLAIAAIVFISVSIVILVYLAFVSLQSVSARAPEAGIVLLAAFLLLVRSLMVYFDFPFALVYGTLFDPVIFRSSAINASLGDLFLNVAALLAVCIYIFRNYYRFAFVGSLKRPAFAWAFSVFGSLCVLFATLFPFIVIQTIYNNSSIVLDISESLSFDELRIVALLTVLMSGICFFLFSHAFLRMLGSDQNRTRVIIGFVIAAIVFAVINESSGQAYRYTLGVAVVYFVTVFFLRLYRSLKRLSYSTFSYLFIATFCISIVGASGVHLFSSKEKIESQFRFASNFLIDRDIFGEYLLHEASLKIANDAFTQARIVTPFLGTEAIGQKIRQVFLPSYFNKYDVEIFIFNSTGETVGNSLAPSFAEMVQRYDADPFRTAYQGIYFVNNPQSDITQKYLIVVPIYRASTISGYVVVELSLKKIIPENVYPELLVDYTFQQFYRTQDISYAVWANDNYVFTSGDFNYQKLFKRSMMGNTRLHTVGMEAFGYDHIAQEDQNGRVALVSTKVSPLTYRVANFSFLFVLGLFVILVLIFFQGLFNYFRGRRLFFSARIQLYLNLAFFIPLIIVSITVVSLTTRSSKQQLDREYRDKSRVFGEEINSYLDDYLFRNIENTISFNNRLSELANLSNLDANIYSPDGALLATSQPLIFETHLLSPYINASAFQKIKSGENSFIESERVGKLEYFIAYTALKSTQTAELIGILGIPFFQSAYFLEQAQIVILTNILNIFAFIFIALLILSYFVSEWLTFPLKFITQSLKRTSLNRLNKPLTWNTTDEIGLMVKEYNAMLYKLSESKNQLEQTQREKAWREIAQQVAHEIKNPLTPMKLTLQQLQRQIENNNSNPDKTQKAVAMLLSQVDTLNDIASSFSGFAKMPEPSIKKLELVSCVRSAVDLHAASGEIAFRSIAKEIFVMGDEQMLNRTFSNIILNGLQSGIPGQAIKINVSISVHLQTVRIEFRDNGKGIDPSIAELVFLPHFSTKKTGSGIGLAISKQGIEQMHGRIWFETKVGEGTSFFIELPTA